MKVRIKIVHDAHWRADLRKHERYWVNLPDGKYLPIFSGAGGNWYQLYAPHMDYPSFEAALAEALKYLYAPYDKQEQWRKCRAKEQVFTFNDRKHSKIKLPPKRSRAQPKPARTDL